MCFKNLPVEFDDAGNARLKGGIPDPYSLTAARPEVALTDAEREEQIKRLMARNGHIREINMDPVTRVASTRRGSSSRGSRARSSCFCTASIHIRRRSSRAA